MNDATSKKARRNNDPTQWVINAGDKDNWRKVLRFFGKFTLSEPLLVSVRRYTPGLEKEFVSNRQSRLIWMWHGEWAKHFGEIDKVEQHEYFKLKFLLPCLLAEDETGYYQSLYDKFRDTPEALSVVAHFLHHRDASLQGMADCLTAYEIHAAQEGCQFTQPSLRWAALMIERGEV